MKIKNQIISSKSGFSLIEVLVAVSLLTVVSMALLAVLDSTNKGQKRAMNRDNLLNLTNQIRSTFTDTALCRQAFIFNIGNTTAFPAAPTINTNYALNRITAFGRDLVLTNAPIPTTTGVSTPPTSAATGLRLQLAASSPSATVGFTNWDATLVIPMVVVNQTSMKDLTIGFLITTDNTTPTVIASCNAMASGTTDQSVCEVLMGGIYNIGQNPQCRLQQTLISPVKFRGNLGVIPAGSFLAVDTPAGSRGLAAYGAGARVGLYPTEADFTTTPANGVALTVPGNNQLRIDASQGILNDGYLHLTRNATGPAFALKLTNSVTAMDVFNLERNGRLSVNTTQTNAWTNLGAIDVASDIFRIYNSAGGLELLVDANGDTGIGPSAGSSKLDVRGDAAGPVINWGLAGGVQGVLSAGVGSAAFTTTAGNAMFIQSNSTATFQSATNMNITSGAVLNIASANNISLSANGGANTVNFTATDADFNRNINAPTINNVSDKRLKTNINKITNVLEKLILLQGHSFVMRNNIHGKTHFGFIAQELQEIFPNLVQENSNGFLSVNYIEIIPLLVESLKETEKRNQHLESRIADMELTLKNIEFTLQKAIKK